MSVIHIYAFIHVAISFMWIRLIHHSHINEFLCVDETRMDECHVRIRIHSCGCFIHVTETHP